MAQNYVLLETIELSQSASSVTFDNLPTTGYTDLKIVVCARSNRATEIRDELLVRLNSDSGNNYSYRTLRGSGSAADSQSGTSGSAIFRNDMPASGATANTFSNQEIYIPNYRGSTAKSISIDSTMENNATSSFIFLTAGIWSGTDPIISITLLPETSTFTANSTFSLYGIASLGTTPVTAPFASGGNIVANDGTYWYHAFLNSGLFTPLKALSCDVLVVAGGGGGGGQNNAGGGGAGGVLGFASQNLLVVSQTVTIGAGGAGSASFVTAASGSNSQFGSLTASVGGGGGAAGSPGGTVGTTPAVGGSGGGGSYDGTPAGALGTTGQGNSGGTGANNPAYNYPGGGGGGAGSAGVTITAGTPLGNGGAGVSTYTNATWLSAGLSATGTGVSGFIAGGGGGGKNGNDGFGAGGSGGGGRGSNGNGYRVAGTVNTGSGGGGGGGGGGGSGNDGASGGSGIVIVRYPMSS
jgi:hypothetical protein